MKTELNTDGIANPDRFAYWREAVCDSYVLLDCETTTPQSFTGKIDLNRYEKLSASYVSGSNQMVTRRKRDVSRSADDSFLISLQLNENATLEQCGRLAALTPGSFALYSSVNRYQLRLPNAFNQLVIQIPRDVLLAQLPNADSLTGMAVSTQGPFGGIVAEVLPKLVNALDDLPKQAQLSGQNAIIDLLVSGLSTLGAASYQVNAPDQQVLIRAKSFIEQNLVNPELDRQLVAYVAGLSVRRLNEVFQKEGSSISQTIQSARYNRIAADLTDFRMQNRTISQIAFSWGVTNFQSFSRGFKKRFGVSPREYRLGQST